jgi:hypothetical protein
MVMPACFSLGFLFTLATTCIGFILAVAAKNPSAPQTLGEFFHV